MKKRPLITVHLIVISVLFILLAISCKKDEGDNPETVTDIDGNVYNTVTIGSQVWMKENLKTTKYNDGVDIPEIANNIEWGNLVSGAYCWYENNETTNKNTYGGLYNWHAINSGKLCPSGWHIPSDAEWTELITNQGGENIAGGKLKEAGTTHWVSPNTGADNKSNFTALPGGYRLTNGDYEGIGYYGVWWSSTGSPSTNGRYWSVLNSESFVDRGPFSKEGFSIRCLKNSIQP